MASTSTYPSLAVPVPEDSMEVSSPGNHHFDGDIDIDFGDSYDTIQFTDDEAMVEDEHTRPGTATDDLMQDDDQATTAPVTEAIMHDGPGVDVNIQQDEDDELIDYDDEEYMDNQTVAGEETLQNVDEYTLDPPDDLPDDGAPVDEHTSQLNETSAESVTAQGQHTPPPAESVLMPNDGDATLPEVQESVVVDEDEHAPEESKAEQETKPLDVDAAQAPLTNDIPVVRDGQEAVVPKASPTPAQTSGTSKDDGHPTPVDTSAGLQNDGSPTPTDTGLHPMSLQWRGETMPLFKSRTQTDGLLKDENIVSVSLADFLSSCKERLSAEWDVHFNPEEDLVLRFQALGLTLVEDSPSSFRTSLHDILELYLQLHRNDSAQDIPPLCLRLSVQPRFSDIVSFLKENADEGSGMSIIDALWVDADDEDQLYSEADDTQQNVAEGDQEHVETDERANDGTGEAYDGEDEYYNPNEDEYNDDAQENNDQDAGTEDKTTEAYNDTDADAIQLPADSGEDNAPVPVGHSTEVEQPAKEDHPAVEVESSGQAPDLSQSGVVQADSVLNSEDVRVAAANDLAGEYLHDDYIDFSDDDDLIESSTESHTASRRHDPSALALSSRADDHEETANQTEAASENPVATDAAADVNKDQETTLTSDGFLNEDLIDYAEDDLDDEEGQDTEPPNPNAPDLQITGKEEEGQFHTAYDLFDDDDGHIDTTHVNGTKDANASSNHAYDAEDVINFDSDDDDVPAAPVVAVAVAQTRQASTGSKRSISALEPDVTDAMATPDVKKTRAA